MSTINTHQIQTFSDDKRYFEAQHQESDEEEDAPDTVGDKQREMFLKYISEDLNLLIKPQEPRGVSPVVSDSSPGTGLSEAGETQVRNPHRKSTHIFPSLNYIFRETFICSWSFVKDK